MQIKRRNRRQPLFWLLLLLGASLVIGQELLSAEQSVPLFHPSETISADKAVSFPTDI